MVPANTFTQILNKLILFNYLLDQLNPRLVIYIIYELQMYHLKNLFLALILLLIISL